MLAAAALRLCVVEALAPTAAIASGSGFPTMAEHRVYDSAAIGVGDLQEDAPYTPSISVYTEDTKIERRGATASSVIGNAMTDLVIMVELAERARDESGIDLKLANGNIATDALINGDAMQRLVLDALTAQVRGHLVRAPASAALRRIMKAVASTRIEPFGLPQYGIRFMRNVITFSVEIADDKFSDASGLPEPMRSVAAELPEGSYAKAQLAKLAAAFHATSRDALAGIDITAEANGTPAMPFVPPTT